MNWTFKTSHAISISSSKSLGFAMLSNVDGPFGVKIKPTIGPKPLDKFMIPNEHHHNQNPHAYAHSNQMF